MHGVFIEEDAAFFRCKKSGKNAYLQIVENRWEAGASKQRVIATLGRLDELRASGQLDRLLASGAKFAESIMVIEAHGRGELPSVCTRRIGQVLIFERLWEESGLRSVIHELLARRKFDFPVERAIFLTVLKRLFGGGSDRLCNKWVVDYKIQGIEGLDLHHLYRAMAWLVLFFTFYGQKRGDFLIIYNAHALNSENVTVEVWRHAWRSLPKSWSSQNLRLCR